MSDTLHFEFPNDAEKLTQKILVDSLRKRLLKESQIHQQQEEHQEPEPLALAEEQTCGTVTEIPEVIDEPMALQLEAGKKYFRIGEVSELIGVEPYVLRYWESEFPTIRPVKSGSGHRVYSRKDVETLHLIRHLLHVEKFSIKGAKKKLLEKKKEIQASKEPDKTMLKSLLAEAKELLQVIKEMPAGV